MTSTYSFDIVSDYDLAEVIHAVDQAKRELGTRYDLKGTNAQLDFRDAGKSGLTVIGDSQYHLDTILDIIRKKLAARGVSQKILDTRKTPVTSNLKVTLDVSFRKGLDQDKAKKISALLRTAFPKLKVLVQGPDIRVISPKKDELQAAIQLLEQQDFDFPLRASNFR